MNTHPLTRERVINQLKEAVELETISIHDELFELGIDSVRLMSLLTSWKKDRPEITFETVLSCQNVQELLTALDLGH